jgi:hypothetical protein
LTSDIAPCIFTESGGAVEGGERKASRDKQANTQHKGWHMTIHMTAAQTAIYDGGDDASRDAMMRELRNAANNLAISTGKTVEVHTADGVVVWSVEVEALP